MIILKLMAGEVNRVREYPQRNRMNMLYKTAPMAEAAMDGEEAAPSFEQKDLFEYKIYVLNTPADIQAYSEKQLSLFEANNIKVKKKYIYDIYKDDKKVNVSVEFQNSKNNNAGLPMPAGKVRVNTQNAADSSIEFIGEDKIEHTPENDTITLTLGKAFDIKVERILKNNQRITRKHWKETYEFNILNSKTEEITITIKEHILNYLKSEIETQQKYRKVNAGLIEFDISIPAKSNKTFAYTISYYE